MDALHMQMSILPLHMRDQVRDRWLQLRLDTILPVIMAKHQLDMWVLIAREYHEDPIMETLFPAAIDSSRRLTIIVFVLNQDKTVERLVIHTNPSFEPFYQRVWEPAEEDQWKCLARIVADKKPQSIGVNVSDDYSFCDGLSHSYYTKLLHTLGEEHAALVRSAEQVALDWLQLRSDEELMAYPTIGAITRKLAQEALSNQVIHPGITTTTEVVRWIRQRVIDLGMQTSFYPTVDVIRKGCGKLDDVVIIPGDIIHLDFGIHYLGLATDTQQLAYVLHIDEHEVPKGLQDAMQTANRLEDIMCENFREKQTGNELFAACIQQAQDEGIRAMIYSHPIGTHCHAAGPLIGLYDRQEAIPVRGELVIQNQTCYAMEFNIRQYIPEWDEEIPIYLEESVAFKDDQVLYLAKRQTDFYIIR
ncbi:Xaa-Pro aminopeptidase [Brevibacillus reuszeri]|uniref:Xaa-Pro aminopeptidase n=1 Tax=Brevibacillus reuszeri TaxID=54915 RepID=A0A0K9YYM9_9BACL|nr:M24 family metallopeptidase [Brevibacillus reuszeri]KNB73737.1 hypothetical protein ADS79_07305 [Brevibacillus reuszeri]MED1858451.1 M24 family metallopeptidase [Brevibacillus reuszeri]GED69427.1 Xaa-Pro aminopeptidase [Brevibacillus reuszeri]